MKKRNKKSLTIAQEVEKAAVLLQKLVRMKASDDNGYCQCVSCKRVAHYKTMDGGHYFSRRHSRLKLYEEQIHPQCKRCNMMMSDPMVQDAYRDYMIEMYGVRRLKALKKLLYLPPKKFIKEEVILFQQKLRERIREQEKRIGE